MNLGTANTPCKFFELMDLTSHPALDPCHVKHGREPKWRHLDVLWRGIKIQGFNQIKKCLRHVTSQNKLYYFSETIFRVRCTVIYVKDMHRSSKEFDFYLSICCPWRCQLTICRKRSKQTWRCRQWRVINVVWMIEFKQIISKRI